MAIPIVMNSTYQTSTGHWTLDPKNAPYGAPKGANFKLWTRTKTDRYFSEEFHIDSNSKGFKAQKPIIEPLIGHNWS